MARTIKENPSPPSIQKGKGELAPADSNIPTNFFSDLNGNQKMEIANHVTNVIQNGLQAFNASEQRRSFEAQYRRDVRLSDNEVEQARIDLERFENECQTELTRIESEAEKARAEHNHKVEQARDYRQLARSCWDHYVETGDSASLHVMQQAILAANQA